MRNEKKYAISKPVCIVIFICFLLLPNIVGIVNSFRVHIWENRQPFIESREIYAEVLQCTPDGCEYQLQIRDLWDEENEILTVRVTPDTKLTATSSNGQTLEQRLIRRETGYRIYIVCRSFDYRDIISGQPYPATEILWPQEVQ